MKKTLSAIVILAMTAGLCALSFFAGANKDELSTGIQRMLTYNVNPAIQQMRQAISDGAARVYAALPKEMPAFLRGKHPGVTDVAIAEVPKGTELVIPITIDRASPRGEPRSLLSYSRLTAESRFHLTLAPPGAVDDS